MTKRIIEEIFCLEDRIITKIESEDMSLADANKILGRLGKMYENIKRVKEDFLEEDE